MIFLAFFSLFFLSSGASQAADRPIVLASLDRSPCQRTLQDLTFESYSERIPFVEKLDILKPHTPRLYVNQDTGEATASGWVLYSEGFSFCHSWVLRNKRSGKVALFHVDRVLSERERDNSSKAFFAAFNAEPGDKEAILIGGTISVLVDYSAEFLKNQGYQIVEVIKADTGRLHWDVAMLESGKQLLVVERKNKRYLFLPGFE